MYRRDREGWMKHLDFLVVDQICLQLSFILAYALRFDFSKLAYSDPEYRSIAVVLLFVDVLISIMMSTLHNVLKRNLYQELASMVKHVLMVFVTITLYLFSAKESETYSRIVLYMAMIIYVVFGLIGRQLWKYIMKRSGKLSTKRTMMIVTNEKNVPEIINDLHDMPRDEYNIIGLTILDSDMVGKTISQIPVLANADSAAEYICREWVDEVYVYLPLDAQKPEKLINQCIEMGVTVHVNITEQIIRGQKQIIEKVGTHTVLTTSICYATPMQAMLKRAMDIVGGLIGCIITGIVLLVVGPMIKKKSPGPIIFKQVRIGKNGKRFTLYKLRSMYLDAEERKKELMAQNRVADGMMFKLDFDPRIIGNEILPDGTKKTGIGELIRKTSLDEFPQFFNVLKGDMSLVGTRPPTVDEWEKYELHHRTRLAIKPGITGMWQVSGRSNITDFEEVVRLDQKYIREWTFDLDLRILVKTVAQVFKHNGAM